MADFDAKRSQDTDLSASTISIDYQRTNAKIFSQELQILSNNTGPLSYVAGYYYFRDDLRGTFINQQLPRTVCSSAVASPITLAQYGQLGYDVNKQFNLSVGAHWTQDKKSFKASITLSSRLAKECVNANIPVVMFTLSADGAQASSVTSNNPKSQALQANFCWKTATAGLPRSPRAKTCQSTVIARRA